jgi:hypothetical protein
MAVVVLLSRPLLKWVVGAEACGSWGMWMYVALQCDARGSSSRGRGAWPELVSRPNEAWQSHCATWRRHFSTTEPIALGANEYDNFHRVSPGHPVVVRFIYCLRAPDLFLPHSSPPRWERCRPLDSHLSSSS